MRLILTLALALLGPPGVPSAIFAAPPNAPRSECDQESERVFGRLPTRFGSARKEAVAEPKTVRRVSPKLPSRWPKKCRGTVSVHEALIAPTGNVERVFTLKSPCAELDRLVSTAIAQWEYTPTKVEDKAIPACITITTLVHLR